MLFFLGNKAFVIAFLETGVTLLCVFAADRKGIVRTEFISLPGIPTGLLSKFIWCVALQIKLLYLRSNWLNSHRFLRESLQPLDYCDWLVDDV